MLLYLAVENDNLSLSFVIQVFSQEIRRFTG